MLPYPSSSSVFIKTSTYINGDCIPEFFLSNTVTILFSFFDRYGVNLFLFFDNLKFVVNTFVGHHSIFVVMVSYKKTNETIT